MIQVSAIPRRNPPTCAHHATPPWVTSPILVTPAINCRKNQYTKIKKAGIGTRKINTSVRMRELG